MLILSKRLKQFIESYPTQHQFATALNVDDSVVSRWLSDKLEVTKDHIEALHRLTGWEVGDLIEIMEDKPA